MSRSSSAAPPGSRRRPAVILAAFASAATAIVATATAIVAIAAGPGDHQHAAPTASTESADVLGRPQPDGHLRLLAFLATQPDAAPSQSRSQAVEVVSLLTQFGAKGLTAEIVDESAAGKQALTNTYYDWQLGGVRLAADPAHSLAERYGVTAAPTTLLLDGTGTVVGRWTSYTPTAQTAQAISERLT